jgi:hypothetical protein
MATVGGSIQEVSVDGRNFAVAADADVTVKLGGFANEVQANGNGTVRVLATNEPWSVSGLQVEIDNNRADHDFLQEKADSHALVTFSITYADGNTRQGKGTITGGIEGSSSSATAALSLMGEGKLELQ